MIYLDTSVALAWLLAEDRAPAPELWANPLVSSRLLEYEIWTRVNMRGGEELRAATQALLARVAMAELGPIVLARAREPFPVPVRTLDALHLASAWFLHENGQALRVATYDHRLRDAALALGLQAIAP